MKAIETIDNTAYQINAETGEVNQMITAVIPLGSKIITPKMQERNKLYQAEILKRNIKNRLNKELGNFYFILTENIFEDIPPQDATRLIMLCSYLNYEGQFMLTQKTPMLKKDIAKVLGLSKSVSFNFWKQVEIKYINERNGYLFIADDNLIFRHKLNHKNDFIAYQKIYIDTVRNLYRQTKTTKHKQLGYVFKLLPYINLEYNIFCDDALQKEIELINPLSLNDFCRLINYDVNRAKRLLNDLKSIEFDYKGRKEKLIAYVDDDKKIIVNPHILYNGSNYHKVEVLGLFY